MIAAESRTESTPPPAPKDGDAVIRLASADEAAHVFRLISDNLEAGHLLPRPLGEVVLHVPRFVVAAGPEGVVACAELARLGPRVAEVRSLVVSEPHRGRGLGTRLLTELVATARRQGYPILCAFTHDPPAVRAAGVLDRSPSVGAGEDINRLPPVCLVSEMPAVCGRARSRRLDE